MTEGVAQGAQAEGAVKADEVKPKPAVLKHLFMIRNAMAGIDGGAPGYHGQMQARLLAGSIEYFARVSSLGRMIMVSSTAPRAIGTAEVLAKELGINEFERIPYLWSGLDAPRDSYQHDCDRRKLMKIVDERRGKAEGLIVVTHYEVVMEFHPYFMEHEFGIRGERMIGEVDNADGIYYDLERKQFKRISGDLVPEKNVEHGS